MDHPRTSRHQIGSLTPETGRLVPDTRRLVPETGRGQARIGPWAGAGLLAGGCLGGGYGFAVGLIAGFGPALGGVVFGSLIGFVAGALIGFLIGVAQVLLRQTPIPGPVVAVAVTELVLLPLQVLAVGGSWQAGPALLIYIPSGLGIATAAVLGSRLPPAKRPLRCRGKRADGLRGYLRNARLFGASRDRPRRL